MAAQIAAPRAGGPVVVGVYLVLHVAMAAVFVLGRAPGTDAAWVGLPLDDAWIHLAYARAFSGVTDFAFVPGQMEPGFTSPLWAFLVSLASIALREPRALVLGVKVLGVAIAIAASVLAHRLAHRITARASAAWLAGTMVALDPDLAFAQVSGMEVLLASACMLAAVLAWVDERPRIAGVWIALAVLTRPECILLAIAAALASHFAREGKRNAATAWIAGPSIAAVLGWAAFCLVQTGRWLPNTWYVKHRAPSTYHALRDAWRIAWPWLLQTPWFFAGCGGLLIVVACRRVLFRTAAPAPLSRDWLLVGLPLVFLLGTAWAHEIMDGHAFYFRRYWLPILPWALVLVAVGAVALIDAARAAIRWRPAAIAGVVALFAVPCVVLPVRLSRQAELYAWNCQNIEEMQVAAATWIGERTQPGEWIAAHDVGALRVIADRPVLDLMGLQDHRMPAQYEALRRATRPRYTVVFPSWFPRMASSRERRVVHRLVTPRYTISDQPDQDVMVVLEDARVR